MWNRPEEGSREVDRAVTAGVAAAIEEVEIEGAATEEAAIEEAVEEEGIHGVEIEGEEEIQEGAIGAEEETAEGDDRDR